MAAIKFLNSITLEGSQIQNFLVQPVGTAPTVYGAGQLYYDTATNKLRLRDNTGWVNIQTGNDGNTTYELEVPTGTTNINLKATNPASDDAIILVGGTNISLVRDNDSQITINTTTTDAVTSVTKSAVNELKGIEVNPTVGNVIVGLDIAGQTPLSVGPDNDDELVLYDSSTTTNKSITVANLMLSAPQGDIKTIGNIFTADGIGLNEDYNISGPELEAMCRIARVIPGVYGARMLGGGDAGASGAIVQPDAVLKLRKAVQDKYGQLCPDYADAYKVHDVKLAPGVTVFDGVF